MASHTNRRRAVWVGGGVALALVLGAVVSATGDGPRRPSAVVAASPSAAPLPTASPSGSPIVPLPGGSRSGSPSAPPTSSAPTPDDYASHFPRDQPDGKPGWERSYAACVPDTPLPSPGTAPFPDMTIALRLPSRTLRGGQTYRATAVLTNTGGRYLRFMLVEYGRHEAALVDGRGNHNATLWSDGVRESFVELAPGASKEVRVALATSVCGDTSADPMTPLPPGTYTVATAIDWSGPSVGTPPAPGRSPRWSEPDHSVRGRWGTPRRTVAVV